VTYLSIDEILLIHEDLINTYGGSHGIRDEQRLFSVVGAPRQAAFGEDQYKTVFEKAAVYTRNIIADHMFVDGNKRTGITSGVVFLMKNGIELSSSDKALEDFAVRIAVDHCSIEQISNWFEDNSSKKT
jgi:death-on-curing protein